MRVREIVILAHLSHSDGFARKRNVFGYMGRCNGVRRFGTPHLCWNYNARKLKSCSQELLKLSGREDSKYSNVKKENDVVFIII